MRTLPVVAAVAAIAYASGSWQLAAAAGVAAAFAFNRRSGIAGASAAAAAAAHFAVAPEHFAEWWGFGLFFVVCGEVQLVWALTFRPRSSARSAAVGLIGSALLVLLWLASRTSGLPFGPDAGSAEAIGSADVFAVVTELLTIAALVANQLRQTGECSPTTARD